MPTSTSSIIQVMTPPVGVAPSQIGNFQATNVTSSSVTLTWTAPAIGDTPIQYQPLVSTSGGAFLPFSTPILATSVVVTGLLPVTQYQFIVQAQNATGTSTSSTVSATTLAVLPGPPTNLGVVGTPTASSVALQWAAPAVGTPPETYQVLYRTPSGSGNFTAGPTTQALTTTVTGLSSATAYDFEVTASNAAGTGPPSVILASVSTAAGTQPPSAPSNLAAGTLTSSSVPLSWTASTGTQPITYTVQYRPH